MQRYEGYGRRGEPSYQTYPSRGAGAIEKYRSAPYGSEQYPRYGGGPRSEPMYGPRPVEPMYGPARPEPGYGYQRSAEPQEFRFWAFRILGLIHIALAVIIFALGVALFALYPPDAATTEARFKTLLGLTYSGFDGACFIIIAPLAMCIGILGFLHTPTRRNLEAVRNSFLVLTVISALLCWSLMVYESLLHGVIFSTGKPSDSKLYAAYALWLCLIVFVALEAAVATVSSFFSCCSPGCCVPIINETTPHTYVYTENEPLPPLFEGGHDYYGHYPPPYGRY